MKHEIKIETGIPIPFGNYRSDSNLGQLRGALQKMKAGDSFIWPNNKLLFDAARLSGTKIKTRKENGSGYRVWRVK